MSFARSARVALGRLESLVGRPDASATADEPTRPSLDEIGLDNGTDKSSARHGYLATYDSVFQHLRDEPVHLLEIGLRRGESLRTWEQYFAHGSVVGVDTDVSRWQPTSDRATVLRADQSDPEDLDRLARQVRPTIVIDDGTHVWRHQIATLQKLFPLVRPGGYYVVEGIHTSFGADHVERYGRDGSTETAFAYVQRIAEAVTGGHRVAVTDDFVAYCRETVASVQVVRNLAILRKREHPQNVYRVRSVAEVGHDVRHADAGGGYPRIPAALVDADESVHAAFDRMYGDGTVVVPPAATAEVSDARVTTAGIITVGDSIIDESLNIARNLTRPSGMYQVVRGEIWVDEKPLPTGRRLTVDGDRRHVLLQHPSDANYGHWMIDVLPRIALLRDRVDLAQCLFAVSEQSSAAMRRVVEDSLGLFGISPEQILVLDRQVHEFERVTVLGSLSRHPLTKSPLLIEILAELGAQVPAAPRRERLYVTRRGVHRRRLVNEDDLTALLVEHDYRVVAPEELTVREQISVFRGATNVVGVMGAALSNLAFSPDGVSTLTLATPVMKHDFFYDIVCLKRGRYRGVQGTAVDRTAPSSLASDFTVDLDRVAEGLAWLESDHR